MPPHSFFVSHHHAVTHLRTHRLGARVGHGSAQRAQPLDRADLSEAARRGLRTKPVKVLRAIPVHEIPRAHPVEIRRAIPVSKIPRAIPVRESEIPRAHPVEIRRAIPVGKIPRAIPVRESEIPRAHPVEIRRAIPVGKIPRAIPVRETRGLSQLGGRDRSPLAARLAADAERVCRTEAVRVKPDRMLCYRGVKAALLSNGIVLKGKDNGGAYAYQAADKLAQHPRFQEMQMERNLPRGADMADLYRAGKLPAPTFRDGRGKVRPLSALPAGAIVVWDQNVKGGLKSGHISVALGDGREASDRFRPQFENLPAGCRVFLPRG